MRGLCSCGCIIALATHTSHVAPPLVSTLLHLPTAVCWPPLPLTTPLNAPVCVYTHPCSSPAISVCTLISGVCPLINGVCPSCYKCPFVIRCPFMAVPTGWRIAHASNAGNALVTVGFFHSCISLFTPIKPVATRRNSRNTYVIPTLHSPYTQSFGQGSIS